MSKSDPASSKSFDPYAELDKNLGERLFEEEESLTQKINEVIKFGIQRSYDGGSVTEKGQRLFLRDAHPKAHGCVRGDFSIRENIPENLRAGVFTEPGKKFKAWFRYSNAGSDVRPDKVGDSRGLAIKLTQVPGEKLDPELPEQTTQDFVMISGPTFFVDDPKLYLKFFTEGPGSLPPPNRAIAGALVTPKIKNPFREVYWSTVPYRLGTGAQARAIKYAALPADCKALSFPLDRVSQQAEIKRLRAANRLTEPLDQAYDEPNFLRSVMVDELKDQEVCFIFGVQPYVDSQKTPIEDSGVNWDDHAAFVPVANIRIAKQFFDNKAQDTFCQNLSFSPWHALPEHKPLGVVNRTRFTVYKAISEFRRTKNNVPMEELKGPTGDEIFE